MELSFTTEPSPDEVSIQDRIRACKISALFDQKMNAADDRTKARDLYDLGFLVESHGDSFSTKRSSGLMYSAKTTKAWQLGIAEHATRIPPKDLTTADDRALAFRIGVVK